MISSAGLENERSFNQDTGAQGNKLWIVKKTFPRFFYSYLRERHAFIFLTNISTTRFFQFLRERVP